MSAETPPGARRIVPDVHSVSMVVLTGALLAGVAGCDSGGAPVTGRPAPPRAREAPEYVAARRAMVGELAEIVSDPRVLAALGRVPRQEFVPPSQRGRAYEPRTPLPIAEDQLISSPEYVAIMTAALELRGDEKALEIGTGSGYQAAVLGELAAEVYTVEIRPRLARMAAARLERLRNAGLLGYRKVEVIEGNGYQGYKPAAPYDAIIVTAAPAEIPVELINQLRIGGRMVIPVGDYYQKLQIIRRRPDGSLEQEILQTVRFVRMVDE